MLLSDGMVQLGIHLTLVYLGHKVCRLLLRTKMMCMLAGDLITLAELQMGIKLPDGRKILNYSNI